jgi:hypothetical protein
MPRRTAVRRGSAPSIIPGVEPAASAVELDIETRSGDKENSRVMLTRAAGGVCLCCGIPTNNMRTRGHRPTEKFLDALEFFFRGKLRFVYKDFPGFMQRSHIYHLHMRTFVRERSTEYLLKKTTDELTFNDDKVALSTRFQRHIPLFALEYMETNAHIHTSVLKPFVGIVIQNFQKLGYSSYLRPHTDLVVNCDENCNRSQTSKSFFPENDTYSAVPVVLFAVLCDTIFDYTKTPPPDTRSMKRSINFNLSFLVVNALQYSALCQHHLNRRDNTTRKLEGESGFLIQLQNNKNLHLCFVLYEYALNMVYNHALIHHNSAIFEMWWRLIVSEYCHIRGQQLCQMVFGKTDEVFQQGLGLPSRDPLDQEDDVPRVLSYIQTFHREIKKFIETTEFQVLMHKLLVIADLGHISLDALDESFKRWTEKQTETDQQHAKILFNYFISNKQIQVLKDKAKHNVDVLNYTNLTYFNPFENNRGELFRLFATTMQLCAKHDEYNYVKRLYQDFIDTAGEHQTFSRRDTIQYQKLRRELLDPPAVVVKIEPVDPIDPVDPAVPPPVPAVHVPDPDPVPPACTLQRAYLPENNLRQAVTHVAEERNHVFRCAV